IHHDLRLGRKLADNPTGEDLQLLPGERGHAVRVERERDVDDRFAPTPVEKLEHADATAPRGGVAVTEMRTQRLHRDWDEFLEGGTTGLLDGDFLRSSAKPTASQTSFLQLDRGEPGHWGHCRSREAQKLPKLPVFSTRSRIRDGGLSDVL